MNPKMRFFVVCALLAFPFLSGCGQTSLTHGVPNLVKVDSRVWRSGQPTSPAAWAYLKSLGITKVIKLNFPSEGTDDGASGLEVYPLSIQPEGDKDVFVNIEKTFVKPDASAVAEVDRLLGTNGMWLVHCTHGQDRTGYIIGRYRVHNGWSTDAAYAEMLKNGFHPELHGLHQSWEDFLKTLPR